MSSARFDGNENILAKIVNPGSHANSLLLPYSNALKRQVYSTLAMYVHTVVFPILFSRHISR